MDILKGLLFSLLQRSAVTLKNWGSPSIQHPSWMFSRPPSKRAPLSVAQEVRAALVPAVRHW